MVIPIYHDSEIAQYPKLIGQHKASHPRVLSKSPIEPSQPKHKRRLGLFRRASSYSPPPKERSQSRSRHQRDHSVPPSQPITTYDGHRYPTTNVTHSRGRSQSRHNRHRSSSSAAPPPFSPYHYTNALGAPYGTTLDRGDRARPPNDPLVTNTPSYQVQATHSSANHYGHSPVSPVSPQYYNGNTTSYGRTHGRQRPPGDPLADNTPGYQVQAMQPQGGIVGGHGGLAGGDDALASANALPSVDGSHYGGGGRPTSHYQAGGGGGYGHHGGVVPTGFHEQSKIQQAAAAVPLVQALSHGTQAQQGQALDAFMQNYFKVLPPNPRWCASRCRGTRKAVCIGINYVGQRDELKGCANDARHMRDFLIQYYGFPPSNIMLLTDDPTSSHPSGKPTRRAMFEAMAWLVQGARKDDSLFFHYSGHGGQSPDASGREVDDMDETIFPVDYKEAGDIIDDELYQTLVKPLPAGCRLTAIFDSCHSGTVLDLPYIHSAHGRLRSMRHVSRRAKTRGMAPSADVICFSACKDDETSADTFKGGVAVGAMSNALVRSLKNNTHQTYEELLTHLREILIPEYDQKAQISASHPLDMKERFTL